MISAIVGGVLAIAWLVSLSWVYQKGKDAGWVEVGKDICEILDKAIETRKLCSYVIDRAVNKVTVERAVPRRDKSGHFIKNDPKIVKGRKR